MFCIRKRSVLNRRLWKSGAVTGRLRLFAQEADFRMISIITRRGGVSHIEDFYRNADVFDYCAQDYHVDICKYPEYSIDYGFDHKQALLEKAAHMKLYKNLIRGDANEKLPFDDNSMKSVYSNMLYWLKDPKAVFSEIYRILMPGGVLCALLITKSHNEFRLSTKTLPEYGPEFTRMLEIIDRGRSHEIRNASDICADDWVETAENCGFKVQSKSTYLSPLYVKAYDIGLRPLFPVLQAITENMPKAERALRKKEFVDLFFNLGYPLLLNDAKLLGKKEGAYCCLILEKRTGNSGYAHTHTLS
jgi:SAM-dependent methyltransferase